LLCSSWIDFSLPFSLLLFPSNPHHIKARNHSHLPVKVFSRLYYAVFLQLCCKLTQFLHFFTSVFPFRENIFVNHTLCVMIQSVLVIRTTFVPLCFSKKNVLITSGAYECSN